MKRINFRSLEEIELVEGTEPQIKYPDDVKIRVDYCALCADDFAFFGDPIRNKKQSRYVGQLFAGTITEIGSASGTMDFVVGDRVSGYIWTFCGKCPYCRLGMENLCINNVSTGGALQEYIVLKDQQICVLPENIPSVTGCLPADVASCMHGIQRTDVGFGDHVLILGAGGIGLLMLQLAKMRGATVTVSEPIETRRLLATRLGADYVLDSNSDAEYLDAMNITNYLGYDVIIDACRNIDAVASAFAMLGRGGKILMNSFYDVGSTLSIDLSMLYAKECSIMSSFMAPYLLPAVMEVLPKLRLHDIVGKVFPMEETKEAVECALQKKYPRVVIKVSN